MAAPFLFDPLLVHIHRMSDSSFIQRSRYFLAYEYPTKIRMAVVGLPQDIVWWRANEESNSIGNLLLHLAGNIRQWVVTGIGGAAGTRVRSLEFSMREGPDAAELLEILESAVRDADAVLATIDSGQLDRELTIQGRQTTVLAAVYHVVEHFSMHAGQIFVIAKMHAPGSVAFYDDAGGLAIPLWGGSEGRRLLEQSKELRVQK